MNALFPILAAVLQASSFALDKAILSLRSVTYKTYAAISFPLVFAITFVIFLIFQPPLSPELLSGKYFWFLLISVVFSFITNIIFYRALDEDRLSEMQMVDLFRNLPLIIFASFIFADERRPVVLLLALISSAALIWSHWKSHHFRMRKHTLPFLFWTLAAAPFGAIISKELLSVWHPISLEFVRSGALALILGPMFFRYGKRVSPGGLVLFLLTNILTAVAWILYYTSYKASGIVYTVLVFSLQPVLVYFASVVFFHEPIERKKLVAFLVVLLSIVIGEALRT